jgi:alpha-amylase
MKSYLSTITAISVASTALCLSPDAQANVVLHAFDWHYGTVTERAQDIAERGYGAVLVAPPNKTQKDGSGNSAWYQHYQPQDLRVIDHSRGNKEDFVRMIRALHDEGVQVYADVVVNQMANDPWSHPDNAYPGQAILGAYSANPTYWNAQRLFGNLSWGLFSGNDFHAPFCIQNFSDRYQSLHGRICGGNGDPGMPDLRDTDDSGAARWVRQVRRDYINALHDLGVDGFRIDAAKHMPTSALTDMLSDVSGRPNAPYVFAEIITWGGPSTSEYFYLGDYLRETPSHYTAYDFPLLNRLKAVFRPEGRMTDLGNPEASGDALPGERALTMTVTHDIPYNNVFRGLIFGDRTDEELAYAYILGRDGGSPMVFDDGSQGRTDNGRWVNAYANARLNSMIRFHNAVEGQGMEVLAANDCALLFRRGQEGVVGINKCGTEQAFSVTTNWRFYWSRDYVDTLSGNRLRITGSPHQFRIPPRDARMWVAAPAR